MRRRRRREEVKDEKLASSKRRGLVSKPIRSAESNHSDESAAATQWHWTNEEKVPLDDAPIDDSRNELAEKQESSERS